MNTSEKTGRGRVRRRTNLSPFRYEKIPTISERLDQIHHLLAEKHWEDCKRQKPFRVEYEVHNVQFVK